MHCQDVSRLSAMHLSRCVVFGQGALCVFYIISAVMHCQDVSSFSNTPVRMCRLWAGGLVCVCVHVCVLSFYLCPKCIVKMCCLSAMHLSRCVVFGQGALCVCVCVFFIISALNA